MFNPERLQQIAHELVTSHSITLPLPVEVNSDPTLQMTAAHETDALPEHGYDSADIIEDWQSSIATGRGLHFILDLDENLFDTVGFWITETKRLLQEKYNVPEDHLPSAEAVLAEGGPSTYYPNHFPEIWSAATSDGSEWLPHTNPKSYEHLAEIWRHEEAGNLHPPLLPGLVPHELMAAFAKHGQVLGGLTARPATARVIEATHQQTTQAGFEQDSNLPIVFRPKAVPLSQSGEEKRKVISSILPENNSRSRVVLFDDSLSTARVMAKHNQEAFPYRKIVYILNAMGPLTAPKMDGAQPKDPALAAQLTEEHGIFVLTSWDSMDEVLTKVQAWHFQNS